MTSRGCVPKMRMMKVKVLAVKREREREGERQISAAGDAFDNGRIANVLQIRVSYSAL